MLQRDGLDFILDLEHGLLARDVLDGLCTVVGEDTLDLVLEHTTEADSAAPGILAVYTPGDALAAEGEAALVDLWRKGPLRWADDLERGKTIPPEFLAWWRILRLVR